MIALLPPFAGTWGPVNVPEGPLVVLPETAAADPRVAEWRAKGTKVWATFDPFVVPEPDRARFPLALLEEAIDFRGEDVRKYGLVALDDPEALKTVVDRAGRLAKLPLDGVCVVARSGYTTLFRHSAAARKLVHAKLGLDPLDFREPLELVVEPTDEVRRREAMPPAMTALLLAEGQRTWREAIRPLKDRPIRLIVDPNLADPAAWDRLPARADWTKALDLQNLRGFVVRAAKDKNAERVAKVRAVKDLSIWVQGYADELEGTPDGTVTLRRTLPR